MSGFSKFLVGLLVTTLLALLAHFIHRDTIAEHLRVSAQKVLDDNYMSWAKISFTEPGWRYRVGVIKGAPPSAESAEGAREMVLDALSNHNFAPRLRLGTDEQVVDARDGAMRIGGVHDVRIVASPVEVAVAEPVPAPEPAVEPAPTPEPAPEVDLCKQEIEKVMANNNVNFRTGSASLEENPNPVLDALTEVAAKCPSAQIAIGGHTDKRGNEVANQSLSQARADTVKAYLVAKSTDAARLTATGHGSSQPLDPADTQEAYSRNRRIEFSVSSAGE
jgi:outer membrane protein OmpA-like peptidoglycan-associated protein